MKKLISYLSELNTLDSSWGLWVDPSNIDSYRVGQMCFDNGGMLDKYVFVGTLNNLSFGFQSIRDILKSYLFPNLSGIGSFNYKGRESKCNVEMLINAYFQEILHDDFYKFLQEEVYTLYNMWSIWEAENFVECVLPEILNREN